jgi:hypothetical protein
MAISSFVHIPAFYGNSTQSVEIGNGILKLAGARSGKQRPCRSEQTALCHSFIVLGSDRLEGLACFAEERNPSRQRARLEPSRQNGDRLTRKSQQLHKLSPLTTLLIIIFVSPHILLSSCKVDAPIHFQAFSPGYTITEAASLPILQLVLHSATHEATCCSSTLPLFESVHTHFKTTSKHL